MTAAAENVYRVTIRHNVVVAIDAVPASDAGPVPDSKLAVTSQLAENNQRHGCIDGEYLFDDVRFARHFAKLALDYTRRLIEKSEDAVQGLERHTGDDGEAWRNPFFGGQG